MDYIEIRIEVPVGITDGRDIAAAMLTEIGIDSVLETEEGLTVYIPANSFDVEVLRNHRLFRHDGGLGFAFSTSLLPGINWNDVWEKSFDPVIIDRKVSVRAPFHQRPDEIIYDIVIEPRMAFGTGHHETTELMMSQMLGQTFKDKTVLDYGAGTGILAILASMMGASSVVAVDNDPVATENCIHNLSVNRISDVTAITGTVSDIRLISGQYDIILANINKNVLTTDMKALSEMLPSGSTILLSGYYSHDVNDIAKSASDSGLDRLSIVEKNEWICEAYVKL